MTGTKVTAETIREMKGRGERIAALTAYDFPMTRLLDDAGLPLILVGDSLGMVVLCYPDTTQVTMNEMEHHVRAAARAKPRALLAADMPCRSYETVEQAVVNARRLAAAGAEAVKAEGGCDIMAQARAIVASGIPFLAQLGMMPQHVVEEGCDSVAQARSLVPSCIPFLGHLAMLPPAVVAEGGYHLTHILSQHAQMAQK